MALDDKSSVSEQRLPAHARVAVVVSEYHQDLTGGMLRSAQGELEAAGLTAGFDEVDFAVPAMESWSAPLAAFASL